MVLLPFSPQIKTHLNTKIMFTKDNLVLLGLVIVGVILASIIVKKIPALNSYEEYYEAA